MSSVIKKTVLKLNDKVVGRGKGFRLAMQDAANNGYPMGPFAIEALSCGRDSFRDKKGLWKLGEEDET